MSSIANPARIEPGTVAAFGMQAPPFGWLEADGAAVSRTLYAGLFDSIGETFGAGDGATTFNIPDLRGEFIRGADNGRGVDAGRVFGSAQADDFKAHSHGQEFSDGTGTQAAEYSERGNFSSYTRQTNSAGGAETRPRNVAMMFCIKF